MIARAQSTSIDLRERGKVTMPGVVDWIVETITSVGEDGSA
jgi:hypothetical protein